MCQWSNVLERQEIGRIREETDEARACIRVNRQAGQPTRTTYVVQTSINCKKISILLT